MNGAGSCGEDCHARCRGLGCGLRKRFPDNFSASAEYDYHAPVIARLSRHLVEVVIGLYALLGFVFVPLGERTGFEHVRAILTTGAAKSAFQELAGAIIRLKNQVLAEPKREPQMPTEPELSITVGWGDAGVDASLQWDGGATDG
jgi:hypothetical protein